MVQQAASLLDLGLRRRLSSLAVFGVCEKGLETPLVNLTLVSY